MLSIVGKLIDLFLRLTASAFSRTPRFHRANLIWTVLGAIVFIVLGLLSKAIALDTSINQFNTPPELSLLLSQTSQPHPQLPPLQPHPLPDFLKEWQSQGGDYFDQVEPTTVGYLVWSEFPVRVYLDRATNSTDTPASNTRVQQWVDAVSQAIQEWNQILPLEILPEPEGADIIIERSRPPLDVRRNPDTGEFEFPRARTAQTQYEFYLSEDDSPLLSHRFTIYLSPHQTQTYTLATARHELGHGLGIWGHSLDKNDVLYFSQVATPPTISGRDINTLKKIYQQPTRLGWTLR